MSTTTVTGSKHKKSKRKKYLSDQVIQALKNKDVSQLKQLQKAGVPLNICDKQGNSLLHLAIQNESELDTFEYLLSLDEMPKDVKNKFGYSPLMEALGLMPPKKDGEEYSIMLIKAGCTYSELFPDGNTLLHLAVYNNWLKTAELLMELGFDVDCVNEDDATPLHVAAKIGNYDFIWMLLFFGADPNLKWLNQRYPLRLTYTYFTFFDLILMSDPKVDLDQFKGYEKHTSLSTFVDLMGSGSETFYKLLEITNEINYTYDDLKALSKNIHLCDRSMFKLFVRDYSYVLEEMFIRCCLDELFYCDDVCYLNNFTENLFTLLESEVRDIFIEKMNTSRLPLIAELVSNFKVYKDQLDLLGQVLCCLLSYGAEIDADGLNELYFTFGYCNFFKIMLHMDIRGASKLVPHIYAMPRIIYDMSFSIDSLISNENYDEHMIYKLSKYFTLKKVPDKSVPSLVELARNCSRHFIISKFKVKTSRQFYSILKKLPIAEIHRKMIAFEIKLYNI